MPDLMACSKHLLITQAYLLTHKDDDGQNVFHKACLNGNLELLEFIHFQARRMGLLDLVINELDLNGVTPIYNLCNRGYDEVKDI